MSSIKHALILAAIFLGGCAAGVKPISSPSGKQGFVINCGGGLRSWAQCYDAATKACGGTYKIVDTATTQRTEISRVLVVECDN